MGLAEPLNPQRVIREAAVTWTIIEGVNYEVACETITHLIALYVEAIEQEEAKPQPNAARVLELNEACLKLAKERKDLRVDDHDKINAICTVYGKAVQQGVGRVTTSAA